MPKGIYKRPSAEDRIQDKIVIDSETGCWIWTGAKNKAGYGQIWYEGKMVGVHCLVYQQHKGEIPKGKCVLHKCDNPPCCNPEHLKLGTNQDNMDDKVRKGRHVSPKGETHGCSRLSDKQVIEIRSRTESQRHLAKEYGVHQTLISLIKRKKIWRHLP